VRPQLNRLLVVGALVIILPLVAMAERIHTGSGRSLARSGVRLVGRLCGVAFDVRVRGEFDSACPYVVVPNHSSPLDIAAMLVACPDARFLAAAGLFRIPLLAGAMRALNTIPIDRHDPDVARRQMAQVMGHPWRISSSKLVVFAEGGIAPRHQRLPFKTGGFVLAIRTGLSVVPVAIHHAEDVLPPHHRLALRPGMITVELLAPIPTGGLAFEDRHALRDRGHDVVTSALERDPA
jgi:1-acyl-sn-glycerol-3-phosphate acyltransferase